GAGDQRASGGVEHAAGVDRALRGLVARRVEVAAELSGGRGLGQRLHAQGNVKVSEHALDDLELIVDGVALDAAARARVGEVEVAVESKVARAGVLLIAVDIDDEEAVALDGQLRTDAGGLDGAGGEVAGDAAVARTQADLQRVGAAQLVARAA